MLALTFTLIACPVFSVRRLIPCDIYTPDTEGIHEAHSHGQRAECSLRPVEIKRVLKKGLYCLLERISSQGNYWRHIKAN